MEFHSHLDGTWRAREPMAQIEDHSKGAELTTSVRENFPVRDGLGGSFGSDWAQRIVVDGSQFKHIVEAVTNELLQWTIELDKRGIKGEHMDFDEKEKQSATHQVFNIQK